MLMPLLREVRVGVSIYTPAFFHVGKHLERLLGVVLEIFFAMKALEH